MGLIESIIFVTGTTATIIIILEKWGLLNKYDDLRASSSTFSKMPERCNFCLGFWICLIQCFIIHGFHIHALSAFACASIVRKIVS